MAAVATAGAGTTGATTTGVSSFTTTAVSFSSTEAASSITTGAGAFSTTAGAGAATTTELVVDLLELELELLELKLLVVVDLAAAVVVSPVGAGVMDEVDENDDSSECDSERDPVCDSVTAAVAPIGASITGGGLFLTTIGAFSSATTNAAGSFSRWSSCFCSLVIA